MKQATDRRIFSLALPAVVTNITVPLLGMADLAIVGHMGSAAYIGAVAVGSMVFNVIYWLFGFLRMGTGGLTSQALGAGDGVHIVRLLRQSLAAAFGIALLLLLGSRLILRLAFMAMEPEPEVASAVERYFSICIWGAPAVMGLYSLTGWFIGMQNTRIPMYVSIVQNIVNLATSVGLVFGLGLRIEGVALGTLVAQWAGFVIALVCLKVTRLVPVLDAATAERLNLWGKDFVRFFTVNRDIFLRTLFLVMVNLFFTSAGSRQGAVMLSANTLLLTLFTITSYFMDGLAYAAEAIGGRFCGAADRVGFVVLVRRLFLWGMVVAVLFTLLFAVGGKPLLELLTTEGEVINAALAYLPWAVAVPLAGVAAFLLDGLFIGITATRAMLWSTLVGATVFFTVFFVLSPFIGNHALWLALLAYLVMRGVVEAFMLRPASPVWKRFGTR